MRAKNNGFNFLPGTAINLKEKGVSEPPRQLQAAPAPWGEGRSPHCPPGLDLGLGWATQRLPCSGCQRAAAELGAGAGVGWAQAWVSLPCFQGLEKVEMTAKLLHDTSWQQHDELITTTIPLAKLRLPGISPRPLHRHPGHGASFIPPF